MTLFASVVFPLPLDQPFLYAVPEDQKALARPGARVVAPLGPRRQNGFIVEVTAEPPAAGIKVKELVKVLDDRPFRDERFLAFTGRLSGEFHSSWGEVLQASLPPSLAARTKVTVVLTEAGREALETKGMGPKARLVGEALRLAPHGRSPLFLIRRTGVTDIHGLVARMERSGLVEVRKEAVKPPAPPKAGESEASIQLGLAFPEAMKDEGVLASVERALADGRPGAWYLFGSAADRRAAYQTLVRRTVGAGGRVLHLFSEVAPTGELAASFRKSYGRRAVVFHGRMTQKQKEDAWRELRGGRAALAAGTRSALFLEMDALRLLIVDDEQDESHVQAESPAFDARRGALLRARSEGAVAVLGSSRPTVEAYAEAEKRGILIALGPEPPRVGVTLVDHARDVPLVSRPLEAKLRANMARGETALLFLNRRGYAAQVECGGCGTVPRCPRCDIALVFHKAENSLICHYCNFSVAVDRACDGCGGRIVVRRGAGTQAVEEELKKLFPGVRVARFDSDTAGTPAVREALLGDFAKGAIPLLVGTQMLVHQPGVPKVGLVGILRPESLLGFSDYRAGQKTFEAVSAMLDLRRDGPGAEAVVQTSAPVHFSIEAAAAGDYRAFYEKEIAFRRMLNYPPFSSLAEVTIQGRDVRALGGRSRELLALFQTHAPALEVLGPAFAPVARVKDLTRVQFVLKAAGRETIDRALRESLTKVRLKKTVTFSYSPFSE
jgi:primosomal protein N' (replication factor Y)